MAGHPPAIALAVFLLAVATAMVAAMAVTAPLSVAVIGVCAGMYVWFHWRHNETPERPSA